MDCTVYGAMTNSQIRLSNLLHFTSLWGRSPGEGKGKSLFTIWVWERWLEAGCNFDFQMPFLKLHSGTPAGVSMAVLEKSAKQKTLYKHG